jgi:hypothetical protein
LIKCRDKKIDILRAIALIAIILAHSEPPTILRQIRSFDVPLMAIVMGASFYITNQDKEVHYGSYVIKRVKRLVIPTWAFLSIFFSLLLFASLIISWKFPFTLKKVIESYALMDGIGYVWIIQVYLGIALLSPPILEFSKRVKRNSVYFLVLGSIYILYYFLTLLSDSLSGISLMLFEHLVLYTIGYSLVAAIGIRIKEMSNKEIGLTTIVFFFIYFIFAIRYNFALTSAAKYPPTIYFLSFGVFASLLFYLLLDNKHIIKFFDSKFIYYLSSNSMWIYLWHIMSTYIVFKLPIINSNFITRFIFELTFGIILTWYAWPRGLSTSS